MSFSPEDLSDRFINAGVSVVSDTLLGLITSNPNIGLLNFGKVIVRRDYTSIGLVKILSGGASGHEPAHAGFVGKGMLTAAVQGDLFCSPTSSDVFRTIKEISYKQDTGILVLVQNNTSDRLNFGLAVERALSEGVSIKMIVVSDDCCCMVNEVQGRRGMCGIFFLEKIAAALAEKETPLEEIYTTCKQLHDNLISILLSLRNCTAPNVESCICMKHMENDEMELGTGIHGEVGMQRMKKTTVIEACKLLLKEILSKDFLLDHTTTVVILINNLGNNLLIEEFTFVKEFVRCIQERETLVARVYHGNFFTSLDMRGFSATILRITDPKILEYLDSPCEATSWRNVNAANLIPTYMERIPARLKGLRKKTPPGPRLGKEVANIFLLGIQFICDALISCTKQINMFDSESGGGNIGSKLKRCCEAILFEAEKKLLDFQHPRILFQSLSMISEKSMGGTLGCLYSILFDSAANSLRNFPEEHQIEIAEWAQCLADANQSLKSYGQVEYGFGTMYDPLYACHLGMTNAINLGNRELEVLEAGVMAAEESVSFTKPKSRRYPDPGAYVVTVWLRALLEAIRLRCGHSC